MLNTFKYKYNLNIQFYLSQKKCFYIITFAVFVIFITVAPVKALCSERYQDWQQKLEDLGIHCLELTGDTELDDCSILQTTNIIITTPVCNMLIKC